MGRKEENMKNNIVTALVIVIVIIVSYAGTRAAYAAYAKSEAIKIEALNPDFVWGEEVQFEVTLKGDEEELYFLGALEGAQNVTEMCQTGNCQFLITVRTELLDEPYYKVVLMYGNKNSKIEIKGR